MSVYLFIERFRLPDNAKNYLILLINSLLPLTNKFPKSYKNLLEILGLSKQKIIYENYCQLCKSRVNRDFKCLNESCKSSDSVCVATNKFCYVPLKTQLSLLIDEYKHDLAFPIKSKQKDLNNSVFYENIMQPNVWHLLLYTDGISLANSSNYSCWPVFISIVELPVGIRQSKKGF